MKGSLEIAQAIEDGIGRLWDGTLEGWRRQLEAYKYPCEPMHYKYSCDTMHYESDAYRYYRRYLAKHQRGLNNTTQYHRALHMTLIAHLAELGEESP